MSKTQLILIFLLIQTTICGHRDSIIDELLLSTNNENFIPYIYDYSQKNILEREKEIFYNKEMTLKDINFSVSSFFEEKMNLDFNEERDIAVSSDFIYLDISQCLSSYRKYTFTQLNYHKKYNYMINEKRDYTKKEIKNPRMEMKINRVDVYDSKTDTDSNDKKSEYQYILVNDNDQNKMKNEAINEVNTRRKKIYEYLFIDYSDIICDKINYTEMFKVLLNKEIREENEIGDNNNLSEDFFNNKMKNILFEAINLIEFDLIIQNNGIVVTFPSINLIQEKDKLIEALNYDSLMINNDKDKDKDKERLISKVEMYFANYYDIDINGLNSNNREIKYYYITKSGENNDIRLNNSKSNSQKDSRYNKAVLNKKTNNSNNKNINIRISEFIMKQKNKDKENGNFRMNSQNSNTTNVANLLISLSKKYKSGFNIKLINYIPKNEVIEVYYLLKEISSELLYNSNGIIDKENSNGNTESINKLEKILINLDSIAKISLRNNVIYFIAFNLILLMSISSAIYFLLYELKAKNEDKYK